MQRSRFRIISVWTMAIALVAGIPATSIAAKKSKSRVAKSVTDLRFKLDDRNVQLGEDVTGTVRARSRSRRTLTPLAGATLSVYLGSTKIDDVVTDEAGLASIVHTPAEPGSFALKIVYSGDSTHKPVKRAQGFKVSAEYFADADGDGYGDAATPEWATEQPEGYVEDATDCDDVDAAVNPGVEEVEANGIDDDCDGETDETAPVEEPVTEPEGTV